MTSVFEQLLHLRRSKTFTPFVIVLKDGRRVEVKRRLQFAFHEDRILVVDPRDVSDIFPTAEVDHIETPQPVN